jgi:myb proto-oncogene protein
LDFDTSYKVKPYAPRGAGSASSAGIESAVISPPKEDAAAAYLPGGRSSSKGEASYKDRKQAPYTPHANARDSAGAPKPQNYTWKSATDASFTDAVGDRDRYKAFNVRRWKEEEDQALQAAVVQFDDKMGYRDWHTISRAVHGRNAKQCRERWLSQLAPSINREPWSAQEEKVLIQAHHDYGNKWTDIAKLLPGRTDNSVKNQWKSIKRRMESNTALSVKKRKSMEKQYGGYYTTLAVLPPKSVSSAGVSAEAAGSSRSRSSSTASDDTNETEDGPNSARSNGIDEADPAVHYDQQSGRAVTPILCTTIAGTYPNDEAGEQGYYGDEDKAALNARMGKEDNDDEPARKRSR